MGSGTERARRLIDVGRTPLTSVTRLRPSVVVWSPAERANRAKCQPAQQHSMGTIKLMILAPVTLQICVRESPTSQALMQLHFFMIDLRGSNFVPTLQRHRNVQKQNAKQNEQSVGVRLI
jgi:hypothetical protein